MGDDAMSLDYINVKNAITTFRSIYSIVASFRSWLVINVEETEYEEPSSFDEIATKTQSIFPKERKGILITLTWDVC